MRKVDVHPAPRIKMSTGGGGVGEGEGFIVAVEWMRCFAIGSGQISRLMGFVMRGIG